MANTYVSFKKGLLANLPNTYSAGTFYVTTDERAIYLDVDGTTRVRLGDFQEFPTLAALEANTNPSTTALYYVDEINCLAKWDGSKYIQINRDTGATAIEVVGSGNAVTGATYDASARKMILTMGETFATREYVGEIPTGEAYADIDTVIGYVNKKAEETLAAAQGGSSETAASVKKALDDYVEVTDPRLEALEAIDHDHTNKTELDKIADGDVAKWNAAEKNAKDHADDLNTAMDTRMQTVEGKAHTHTFVESELNKIADGDVAKWNAAQANAETTAANALSAAKQELEGKIAEKVASVGAGDASVTVGGTATAPTVAVKLSAGAGNAITLEEDGLKVVIPAAAEYTIEKAAESGDYAAVYALKKDGVQVGASINIPKDMVVESGAVVEDPEGQAEGTYIKLVLQNVAEPLYINVGSLIEYVTSGSQTGDMIVVNVSDDHKVTATITDGTITLVKLDEETQAEIKKAHEHDNMQVIAGITAQKVEDWNTAVTVAQSAFSGLESEIARSTRVDEGHTSAIQAANKSIDDINAKIGTVADGKTVIEMISDAQDAATYDDTALKNRVAAVEGKAHEHANAAELAKIADGDVAKWNGAQAAAEATAAAALAGAKTELQGNIDKKANADNVYTKTETYTQTEVNTAIQTAVEAATIWGEF